MNSKPAGIRRADLYICRNMAADFFRVLHVIVTSAADASALHKSSRFQAAGQAVLIKPGDVYTAHLIVQVVPRGIDLHIVGGMA